jgi:hypothetical protein
MATWWQTRPRLRAHARGHAARARRPAIASAFGAVGTAAARCTAAAGGRGSRPGRQGRAGSTGSLGCFAAGRSSVNYTTTSFHSAAGSMLFSNLHKLQNNLLFFRATVHPRVARPKTAAPSRRLLPTLLGPIRIVQALILSAYCSQLTGLSI